MTMAKENLGNQNVKLAARHKSDDAHGQYQQSAATLHDRRFRTMWSAVGGTDKIDGKLKSVWNCDRFAYFQLSPNYFATSIIDDEMKPAAVDFMATAALPRPPPHGIADYSLCSSSFL
jgi:hypothetical protein